MSGTANCGACGARIPDGAAFCPKCGAAQGAGSGEAGPRTFAGAIRICLEKYATFSGRAPRSEYWYWMLFAALVWIVAVFAAVLADEAAGTRVIRPVCEILLVLVFFLPDLAVAVRRLHDRDRSGWWYLLGLVPLVGGIILLVWFCLAGTRGANRFGPDPLAAGV